MARQSITIASVECNVGGYPRSHSNTESYTVTLLSGGHSNRSCNTSEQFVMIVLAKPDKDGKKVRPETRQMLHMESLLYRFGHFHLFEKGENSL